MKSPLIIRRCGRTVAISNEVVFKYAHDLGGREQNQDEWRLWRRIRKTADCCYFAPVLAYGRGGVWLVQQRITPSRRATVEEGAIIKAVANRWKLYDVNGRAWEPNSTTKWNWAATVAGPIIVDYGI